MDINYKSQKVFLVDLKEGGQNRKRQLDKEQDTLKNASRIEISFIPTNDPLHL